MVLGFRLDASFSLFHIFVVWQSSAFSAECRSHLGSGAVIMRTNDSFEVI